MPLNKEKRKKYLIEYNTSPNCKEYMREYRLKSRFGINQEEYNKLFEEQNGVCAICGKEEKDISSWTNKPKFLCVDHDHKTGKIRGLLCGRCNTSIGKFEDDVNLLQNAIEYINKNSTKSH